MNSFLQKIKVLLLLLCFIIAHSLNAASMTFTVTNTSDDLTLTGPPGSLRRAIRDCNANVGFLNNIIFNIPGDGPFRIQPLTELPAIINPVNIDGYQQLGSSKNTLAQGTNAVLMIEINGSNYKVGDGVTTGFGFKLAPGSNIVDVGSTIKGLVINEWIYAGIGVIGNSNNHTIVGNFIGTDTSGMTVLPNSIGILVASEEFGVLFVDNIVIGTPQVEDRNLIAGSFYSPPSGIFFAGGISLSSTSNCKIQNNLIGTDRTGSFALGKMGIGVWAQGVANCLIGGPIQNEGNIISGATAFGVWSDTAFNFFGKGITIQGNFIGTDVRGLKAIGNLTAGVFIENNEATYDLFLLDNLISGNGTSNEEDLSSGKNKDTVPGNGVGVLFNTRVPSSARFFIQGNKIGTSITGKNALPNQGEGIWCNLNGVTIGGSKPTECNIISGNKKNGILIDAFASNTVVIGNYIGTDITGKHALGNGLNGIQLGIRGAVIASVSNIIGGIDPGEGNLISGNFKNGILIENNSINNLIQGNFIGTNSTGKKPIPNHKNGIKVTYSFGNMIGGFNLGRAASNIIAFNKCNGVAIGANSEDNISINNSILTNRIFSNRRLGIFIPHSPLGTGPNQGIRKPIIKLAELEGANGHIKGSLIGLANQNYLIQVFYASNNGEGKKFLAQQIVSTDGEGNALFSIITRAHPGSIVAAASLIDCITGVPIETSEFSKPKKFKNFVAFKGCEYEKIL